MFFTNNNNKKQKYQCATENDRFFRRFIMKRFLSFFISAAVIMSNALVPKVTADDISVNDVDALQYSYEITPLLEPFNEFFYLKTDNPDPNSFRLIDKDTPYSDSSLFYNSTTLYADVEYENEEVYRVKGGYIFRSNTTDGGNITLQVREYVTREEVAAAAGVSPDEAFSMPEGYDCDSFGFYKWSDSDVNLILPSLTGEIDYLIDTYATESDFFSNMDAVQSGFSSICLYSGSAIRGELYKCGDFWEVTAHTHIDQSFYIFSPYDRKEGKSILASAIYPYRYDSLGFPSVMASVAASLSDEATCEWDDYNHYLINVTYNGETRKYGGAGIGEGQGISEDKIIRVFSFGNNDESLTLEESKALLEEYAALEMEDDIPRDDELTWESICNTVGDGAWVRVANGYHSYFYKADDRNSFGADEWGVGYSLYWGGSLGYASDMWVDGRYVSNNEIFIIGEKFEDHPQSNILLTETEVPYFTAFERTWNHETEEYVYNAEVATFSQKNVIYRYNSEENLWIADVTWGDIYKGYDSFYNFKLLTDLNVIDEKYYNMLVLTPEEAEEIVNKNINNTNIIPQEGYVYDGTMKPGLKYNFGEYDDQLGYLKIDSNTDGSYDYIFIQYCKTDATEVEIPSEIDGVPVTTIGSNAFAQCDNLKIITLPESVSSIGRHAFAYCENLRKIAVENPDCEIYDSAETIYSSENYYLENIYIYEGVIYGVKNSTAQAYAEKYGYTFDLLENIDALSGDANNDGELNVRDCATIAGALSRGEADKLPDNSDFSGDGNINVRDAAAIAKYLADNH